jgi:hypothetical protein
LPKSGGFLDLVNAGGAGMSSLLVACGWPVVGRFYRFCVERPGTIFLHGARKVGEEMIDATKDSIRRRPTYCRFSPAF